MSLVVFRLPPSNLGARLGLKLRHLHLVGGRSNSLIIFGSPRGREGESLWIGCKATGHRQLGVGTRIENILGCKWIKPRMLIAECRWMITEHFAKSKPSTRTSRVVGPPRNEKARCAGLS